MRKAFTLIEMLIVVVVLTTLMAIVFRLSSIGKDSTSRSVTIARMQKLENCLSGYYAAFGSYPPVKVHGSRDINLKVENDIQTDEEQEPEWDRESDAWRQVKAACQAQPLACNYPFAEGFSDFVHTLSEQIRSIVNERVDGYGAYWNNEYNRTRFSEPFDDGATGTGTSRFSGLGGKTDWRNLQLFRFGVMSFLLPRYLIMMDSYIGFYNFDQWSDSNNQPCDPFLGNKMTWQDVQNLAEGKNASDTAKLANVPSQAATMRWMPNLERICRCNHATSIFGIKIDDGQVLSVDNAYFRLDLYRPGGKSGKQYILDGITVLDGWDSEFYYYSPAPYQRYTLWSAGANGKTFPPWVPKDKLSSQAKEIVSKWVKDDIISMSN